MPVVAPGNILDLLRPGLYKAAHEAGVHPLIITYIDLNWEEWKDEMLSSLLDFYVSMCVDNATSYEGFPSKSIALKWEVGNGDHK
jgi:hypothetical protein